MFIPYQLHKTSETISDDADCNYIRKFKQITTAGAITVAVTEKVWGEYVSVVCQILSLANEAKYKDERNIS